MVKTTEEIKKVKVTNGIGLGFSIAAGMILFMIVASPVLFILMAVLSAILMI